MQERKFYPMITDTVRDLLDLCIKQEETATCLLILCFYPNVEDLDLDDSYNPQMPPIYRLLINELDRQYSRWNKGRNNGDI